MELVFNDPTTNFPTTVGVRFNADFPDQLEICINSGSGTDFARVDTNEFLTALPAFIASAKIAAARRSQITS